NTHHGPGFHGAPSTAGTGRVTRFRARIIPDVRATRYSSRRIPLLAVALVCCSVAQPTAHDAERTEASLRFLSDGSFVLDVANDADWLLLRLEPFAAESGIAGASLVPRAVASTAERDARLASFAPMFIDRVVLWIDGTEIRP